MVSLPFRPAKSRIPGTQAVRGLIPERRGQAYRPARISRIKGRAKPITEVDLAADPEGRADQRGVPREGLRMARGGTTEARGPLPNRAERRGARPASRGTDWDAKTSIGRHASSGHPR